ncbi:hypothetical protein [Nitrosomonas mobilis]|uniref:hypothetical protein n=1 Tax=Nitrosomonas mobilis TaxID=51642 RepID=UPI001FDED48D|nr:hypothetical protein [Nitrosomonas mobilis]
MAALFAYSDDSSYRAYQTDLMEYNCAFAVRIHNSTSSQQHQHALKRLKNWENYLRTLMVSGC